MFFGFNLFRPSRSTNLDGEGNRYKNTSGETPSTQILPIEVGDRIITHVRNSSTPQTRVLFIDHTSKLSGAEIALFNLIVTLDKTKYFPIVVLFTEGDLAEKLRISGVEVHILSVKNIIVNTRKEKIGIRSITRWSDLSAFLTTTRNLTKLIRTLKPDIVHTNSLKSDVIGGFASRLARKRLVWHIHDNITPEYLPKFAVIAIKVLARFLPNLVIANSQSTLSTLSLPLSKSSGVIHCGVRIDPLPPKRNWHSPVRIGIVGRISRWKGQHVFLEAASRVHAKFPDTEFVIIGSSLFGEEIYQEELNGISVKHNMDGYVKYEGFRTDISDAISELDILVHASILPEPFGQVIVEGLAGEKPVVATAGGGVLEIITNGETGYLVPMNDSDAMSSAICEILENPEKSVSMAMRGRAMVTKRFDLAVTTLALEKLYTGLLTR